MSITRKLHRKIDIQEQKWSGTCAKKNGAECF